MTIPLGASLADAKAWLDLALYNEGATCPCCGQFAKIYRRTITSGMARALILFYREGGTKEWVHGPTLLGGARADEAKLRYWNLIEEATGKRDDGGRAGYWRVTRRGERFVNGTLVLPKYALVFNGDLIEFDDEEHVDIIDALGTRFDYAELMGRPAIPRQRKR